MLICNWDGTELILNGLLFKHRNSLSYRTDVRYLSVSCVDNLKKRFLPEFILSVAEGVEMTFLDLGNSPLRYFMARIPSLLKEQEFPAHICG